MFKKQETLSTIGQTVENQSPETWHSWGRFIFFTAIFSPVFLTDQSSFLPTYFFNGFYLALLFALAGSVLAASRLLRRPTIWKWSKVDVAAGLFALYFLIRFSFTPSAHWSQGRFVWWVGMFVMYGVFRVLFSHRHYSGIWTAFMLIALTQIGIGQLQLMGMMPSQHSQFTITGTFFNPAPYSGFLAVIFPLALFEGLKTDRALVTWRKYLAWLVVAGTLLVILPAQSRAAWLALVGGSVWVLANRFNGFTHLRKWPKPRLALVTLSLICLTTFGGYFLYQFKADSASGRLLVWKVSSQMWWESPMLGHGATRFANDYMLAQADYFASGRGSSEEKLLAGKVSYAYNEFLQSGVEYGVVGLVILLSVFILSLGANNTAVPEKQESLLIPIKAALLSWMIFACFSYPFDAWGTALLLVFLLAFLAESGAPVPFSFVVKTRTAKVFTGAVFLFSALFIAFWIWQTYPAKTLWERGFGNYRFGQYREAQKKYAKAFDALQYEGLYLQYAGKCLSQLGRYEESNTLLRLAKDYYNDPVLYTTMGENYTQLQQYPQAEKALVCAQNMIPHRIYPSYLLAQMYYAGQQREKAAQTASELLEKEVKVSSQATDEMIRHLKLLSVIDH